MSLPVSRCALALALASCAAEDDGRSPTASETLRLDAVRPSIVLPGSRIQIDGHAFLEDDLGSSWLRLAGSIDGVRINADLPAWFDDYDQMHVDYDASVASRLGVSSGRFSGTATVLAELRRDGSEHTSNPIAAALEFEDLLEPVLDDALRSGVIYVNTPIPVDGEGFLLGGDEGTTFAVVEGCFTAEGDTDCGPPLQHEVALTPREPFDRTHGSFPFSPNIAGIRAGDFDGTLRLVNRFPDGTRLQSEAVPVSYQLIESAVADMSEGGSIGQYVDLVGGGFVGDEDGVTVIILDGQFFPDEGGGSIPARDVELFPLFDDGERLRYVLNETDALGQLLSQLEGGIRYNPGTFVGTVRPEVNYGDQRVLGPATEVSFEVRTVKQVVWVDFNPTYTVSLSAFGLRGVDSMVRDRVFEVLRRDYASLNVEFRDGDEPPDDFAEYTTVEINGTDPNGLGLLGYDNTPGKDVGNVRLADRIGGVNALTQEDDYPGYGGVFIESLMAYSTHPPSGLRPSESANVLFDAIFDPVRPDRGRPFDAADSIDGPIPVLTSGSSCPSSDRRLQIACAVWVLGSLIGTTTSHEVGHALGLADPGSTGRYHNYGGGERRLMDAGGERPFEERAELQGQGPSMFCDDAYQYLREILPTTEPETAIARPAC